MKMRFVSMFTCAVALSAAASAAEFTSAPALVYLHPERSSFWHTATNSTLSVPISFPAAAETARLSVKGLGYSRTYPAIPSGTKEYTVELPEADGPETENVYELKLEFSDGTVRTAKLGLINALLPDGEGLTRCLAPMGGRAWERVSERAVLPIPCGMTSFSVNGETVDTGLDGAQGWYAFSVTPGSVAELSMTVGGSLYTALLRAPAGIFMRVR